MQIIHRIDDFFYTIFPQVKKGDQQALQDAVQKYYTYGPYKPKVTIDSEWVTIEIDTPAILEQDSDYKKVIALCERGKYPEAKPILTRLIEKNPTNSEYYRIMGQILSDEGDQEEAINTLIDALRWDSKNGWALLMMGNILAKYKDDIPTAMKYYDQALIANPKDNITINNIGANLMQQGNIEEAKKYFRKALQIDDQYPNTHFALGMIADMEADYHTAFNCTIQAIKLNKRRDALHQNSVNLALEVAKKVLSTDSVEKIYQEYRHKLEFEDDREIDLVEDNEIPTSAKFEFAENYNRDKHIIRYKPNYPGFEHLIMHELVHLDFVIAARKDGLNQLFISDQDHKKNFIRKIEPSLKKLSRMGISDESIAEYTTSFSTGLTNKSSIHQLICLSKIIFSMGSQN